MELFQSLLEISEGKKKQPTHNKDGNGGEMKPSE